MLTPAFGEELKNVGFPVALNLMEKSACRGERIDLSGKGLGEGLLLCFSTGTHLPSLPLETSVFARMRTSSVY